MVKSVSELKLKHSRSQFWETFISVFLFQVLWKLKPNFVEGGSPHPKPSLSDILQVCCKNECWNVGKKMNPICVPGRIQACNKRNVIETVICLKFQPLGSNHVPAHCKALLVKLNPICSFRELGGGGGAAQVLVMKGGD